ncbi:uncharacterized protein LOC142629699 [Castanea sativa]|uniref:uncharacterized protein LOC142629699 n=1 Tax=Castanea sativa TaxID=21020 RepID=UPI003F64C9EC
MQQLKLWDSLHGKTEEIKRVRREINEIQCREEMMWNQRSRALWLKWGDRNAKFFTRLQAKERGKIGLWGCKIQLENGRKGKLSHQGVYDKVTQFLPTYSYCVQKDYRLCSKRRKGLGALKWDCNYEGDSGQKLNKEKTSLYFSKNTSREIKEYVKEKFGARVVQHHEKYLALPPFVGRGKRKAFNRIKDQVGRKIASWKGKLHFHAGREILIKAVAQAMPTYTMSCFKLPDTLCKELNSLMRNFWWGQKDKERKMAWVSWEKLCIPKVEGGMEKVSSLVDVDRRGWDVGKVKNMFLPHEAELILSIPISARLPEDSLIWAWTSNGRFIVKSAYNVAQKVLKEGGRGEEGGSSDNTGMRGIWTMVCRLNCPNKIKHLL